MSKIHLYRKDTIYGFTDAETECGIIIDNDYVETIDHTKVKCERCKKTQAFKDLERTNNETKEAIEEMNEIREEAIKKFKDSEDLCKSCEGCPTDRKADKQVQYDETDSYFINCTHYEKKKDSEPKRTPVNCDICDLLCSDECPYPELHFNLNSCHAWISTVKPKTYKQKIEIEVPIGYEVDVVKAMRQGVFYVDFKQKVKTGAELVGCLCGVSAMNISEAKIYSENLQNLKVVNNYKDGYYGTSGGQYKYVYPVPAEKLAELKANLEREV
jgi:hypothetical protein